MPLATASEFRALSREKKNFGALYTAIILFSFHWSIVLYIDSSFLEQFFSKHTISLLYGISALLSIIAFLGIPRLLSYIGNYTATLFFTLGEVIALLGMAMSNSSFMALIAFCVHATVTPLILYHIDIFMEAFTGNDERETGSKRGLMLGIMALTMALAALFSGYLVDGAESHFSFAYIASTLFLLPFLLIFMRSFKTFEDPHYPRLNITHGVRYFLAHRNMSGVFSARFILEIFFTWMVIYTPLYLSSIIGFDWETIGTILFVGLLAYVFLEYAIGIIADRYIGEKEMMFVGFVIIGFFTAWCTFLPPEPAFWMFAMFMTRVGASLVETTTESYFFKHTGGKDVNLVSFFRITRPLSYIVGAFLGSLTIALFNIEMIFMVLGILMIPGLFAVLVLTDTK